jgi:hypothetical protein
MDFEPFRRATLLTSVAVAGQRRPPGAGPVLVLHIVGHPPPLAWVDAQPRAPGFTVLIYPPPVPAPPAQDRGPA